MVRRTVNTTNHVEHGLKQDYPSMRVPRRATGIPTNVLAAQHRIQRDGSLAFAESFALPFAEGDVICGKYRVQELIGVGGVGFVVSAQHLQLEDSVALKLLKPEFAANPEAVNAFSLEARASFRIRSEHVARVYDVDVLPNGTPFMVMELLRGEDLRTIIKRHRTLPIEFAVDIALQTCEALAAAHAGGVVHRDVKPENLFVTQAGEMPHIKVLDFGISQALATSPFRVPGAGLPTTIAVGTPPYMSPEQIRGAIDLDGRADLWSLGCVLYELLTGFAPFARMSVMQACAAVLEEEPAPLRESRAGIPPSLEVAVMRCLKKAPEQRYADVAELAEVLSPYSRHATYCAQRCAALLSKEPSRSSSVPARRVEPPPPPGTDAPRLRSSTNAHAPVRRLSTNADPAHSSQSVRRPTLNPVPAAPLARTASIALAAVPVTSLPAQDVAVPAPHATASASQPADLGIDDDIDFVPGLRPRRMRWVVLTATASVAVGLGYLVMVGLDRAVPVRPILKRAALTAEVVPSPSPTIE